MKASLLLFLIIIPLSNLLFTQDKNPPEWPYGGVPDESRREYWMKKPPLDFDNKIEFSYDHFYNTANFVGANFDSLAYFKAVEFDSLADFEKASFSGVADFGGFFMPDRKTVFRDRVNFSFSEFGDFAYFSIIRFDSLADFSKIKFSKKADFSYTEFHSFVEFGGTLFSDEVNFEECIFKNRVSFAGVNFSKGVEFRRTNFDSVKSIYISHSTSFPIGKLYNYWDQFKAKDKLRIKLHGLWSMDNPKKNYLRIESFYKDLRDNYLAQGNNAAADGVMYELGWQRSEILNELGWKLYGWFFGWGYQPWRFLIFVVLPMILIFSGLWYWFFYPVLASFFETEVVKRIPGKFDRSEPKADRIISIFGKIKFSVYDHSRIGDEIDFLARVWQVIFFSASVLLGIRFKKEWIQRDNKKFLTAVTIEWILGIGLYVAFAVLVKNNQFAYIKGLLGF